MDVSEVTAGKSATSTTVGRTRNTTGMSMSSDGDAVDEPAYGGDLDPHRHRVERIDERHSRRRVVAGSTALLRQRSACDPRDPVEGGDG